MKYTPLQFVGVTGSRAELLYNLRCLATCLLASLLCGSSLARAQVRHSSSNTQAISASAKTGETELDNRIAAAAAARNAGDFGAVALANERLIATALREMASLRMLEAAYPQAIYLYRNSLDFEDAPGTMVDLAMAQLQAGQFDEAIRSAEQALAKDPNDIRTDRILGSALAQKEEYALAVAPLTRVATAQPSIENLYSLAIDLLETGKPEDKARAEAVFGQMKQQAGDSGSLHVLFGRAHRDAGDMPAALQEFQRAVAIDPRTPHAHYFLGLAELALNEWKPTADAEAEFKKEVENNPHDYLANYMLGFLSSGERQYEIANKYLEAAAAINPTAPEPFLYLGLNAYSQDDMKRAETMLRKAVELTGSDEARSNYQIRRAYVDLGRILTNSGRKDEAEAFLTKAHDLQNKTMAQSQQSIATIAAEGALAGGAGSAAAVVPLSRKQENDSAPVLEYTGDASDRLDASTLEHSRLTAEQRAAIDKRDTALRAVLGLAYNDLATSEAIRGEYPRALSYYQQAERWDNTLPGLEKNLGQCAFRAGDFAEAARGLSLALRAQPEATSVRAMLGMAYFGTSQFAEAAKTFSPLGARGMRDSETGYAWAASLARTGDLTKATEVLSAFESESRSNDVLLLIGQLWTQIGDYSRAITTLQRAVQADPSLPRAHYSMGLAYIRWEHWPDAAKELQAELRLTPNDPDALYHLGFVDMQEAKDDEAVALFRQVVDERPDYANAQYQLGKILLDRGQVADAVSYLETAARLSPQTDFMHYQLQAAYRKENRIAEADRELAIYKQIKANSRERAAEGIKVTQ
jgi:tetratricopeptide (TPR) repeat protein